MTATMLRTEDLTALRRCAHDGTLELHYQPEVDLATGAIVAMEGLLRWHRGDLGVLMPLDFLDLAERSGDILSIGEWVVFEAAAEAARWRSIPGDARQLWINVSPAQLASDGFADLIALAIADADLPKGALGLEVTEASLAMLGNKAVQVLNDLKEAGVSLAVDDFGTWYSTLGAFAELPLDCVKLDHRYVRGVGGDLEDDTIVESVISLAHARGLYVVAEGVESWSESARLTELGCDRAHGYLFASPQRADRARWLLSQGAGWRGAVFVPQPRPIEDPPA